MLAFDVRNMASVGAIVTALELAVENAGPVRVFSRVWRTGRSVMTLHPYGQNRDCVSRQMRVNLPDRRESASSALFSARDPP